LAVEVKPAGEISGTPLEISLFNSPLVGEIQSAFERAFPNLRLEIYKQLELNGIRITKKMENTYQLPEFSEKPSAVTSDNTVAQLKAIFSKIAGHSARVFRKAGSLWIETSLTDDWTLSRQNEEGQL